MADSDSTARSDVDGTPDDSNAENWAKPKTSRRRLAISIAAVAVLALLGGGAALVVPALAQPPADDSTQRPPAATDTVSRGDLTERVRTGGKLAYGNSRALGSGLPGTVTAVPAVGSVIRARRGAVPHR